MNFRKSPYKIYKSFYREIVMDYSQFLRYTCTGRAPWTLQLQKQWKWKSRASFWRYSRKSILTIQFFELWELPIRKMLISGRSWCGSSTVKISAEPHYLDLRKFNVSVFHCYPPNAMTRLCQNTRTESVTFTALHRVRLHNFTTLWCTREGVVNFWTPCVTGLLCTSVYRCSSSRRWRS